MDFTEPAKFDGLPFPTVSADGTRKWHQEVTEAALKELTRMGFNGDLSTLPGVNNAYIPLSWRQLTAGTFLAEVSGPPGGGKSTVFDRKMQEGNFFPEYLIREPTNLAREAARYPQIRKLIETQGNVYCLEDLMQIIEERKFSPGPHSPNAFLVEYYKRLNMNLAWEMMDKAERMEILPHPGLIERGMVDSSVFCTAMSQAGKLGFVLTSMMYNALFAPGGSEHFLPEKGRFYAVIHILCSPATSLKRKTRSEIVNPRFLNVLYQQYLLLHYRALNSIANNGQIAYVCINGDQDFEAVYEGFNNAMELFMDGSKIYLTMQEYLRQKGIDIDLEE